MKRDIYFSNINDVGILYLDYIFLKFENEPLLFTCVDENGRIYFCHCYKMLYEQKWFVLPISADDLNALVNGITDIRSTILSSSRILGITRFADGKELNSWMRKCDICEDDLPINGIFLECNREEANRYINKINTAVTEFGSETTLKGWVASYSVNEIKRVVFSNGTLNRESVLLADVGPSCEKKSYKCESFYYNSHSDKYQMIYEDSKMKMLNCSDLNAEYMYAS